MRENDFQACPLCQSKATQKFRMDDERTYHHCLYCKLIFLDRRLLPAPQEEKARYDEHNNEPADEGYVRFLYRIIEPARAYLHSDMRGLDYGCGPAPVLARLLEQEFGLRCAYYDPFYFPSWPSGAFDLVISTEAFEHFAEPRREISRIGQLMQEEAYLFIMTRQWHSLQRFCNWWYRRDFTHVSFYHRESMQYICREFGFRMLYDDHESICLLQKC
jgi:hypothetical protein